jgi:hypothetical protein
MTGFAGLTRGSRASPDLLWPALLPDVSEEQEDQDHDEDDDKQRVDHVVVLPGGPIDGPNR